MSTVIMMTSRLPQTFGAKFAQEESLELQRLELRCIFTILGMWMLSARQAPSPDFVPG